jgi:predicted kinase
MTAPKLYLFVGYPGAGKTTIAKLISEHSGAVHIWADQERQDMFGQPSLDEQQIHTFYDQLNGEAETYLSEGKSVVFDTNFNFRSDRDYLRSLAVKHHAQTVLIWLTTSVEIARIRAVEQSHGKDTRVWGNMTPQDFERLSNRLETPAPEEQAIEINGAAINEANVFQQLGLS